MVPGIAVEDADRIGTGNREGEAQPLDRSADCGASLHLDPRHDLDAGGRAALEPDCGALLGHVLVCSSYLADVRRPSKIVRRALELLPGASGVLRVDDGPFFCNGLAPGASLTCLSAWILFGRCRAAWALFLDLPLGFG